MQGQLESSQLDLFIQTFFSAIATLMGTILSLCHVLLRQNAQADSFQGPKIGVTSYSSGGSVVKNLSANAGDMGSIPESGRSPGEGNGNPFQYSYLGNPMDRGVQPATVHGVTEESDMIQQLNNNRYSSALGFSLKLNNTVCCLRFGAGVRNLVTYLIYICPFPQSLGEIVCSSFLGETLSISYPTSFGERTDCLSLNGKKLSFLYNENIFFNFLIEG